MPAMKTLGKVILATAILLGASQSYAAPVNVNTADAATLAQNINGIGPKKAQAIVNYRKQNGPFKSVDDLVKVKGIGLKIVEKNKADLLFDTTESGKAVRSTKKN